MKTIILLTLLYLKDVRGGIKNKIRFAQENISELENTEKEIIQKEVQRVKKKKQ